MWYTRIPPLASLHSHFYNSYTMPRAEVPIKRHPSRDQRLLSAIAEFNRLQREHDNYPRLRKLYTARFGDAIHNEDVGVGVSIDLFDTLTFLGLRLLGLRLLLRLRPFLGLMLFLGLSFLDCVAQSYLRKYRVLYFETPCI